MLRTRWGRDDNVKNDSEKKGNYSAVIGMSLSGHRNPTPKQKKGAENNCDKWQQRWGEDEKDLFLLLRGGGRRGAKGVDSVVFTEYEVLRT